MTRKLDKIMTWAGFELEEVEGVEHRKFLYFGNLAMLFLAGLFLAMWVLN